MREKEHFVGKTRVYESHYYYLSTESIIKFQTVSLIRRDLTRILFVNLDKLVKKFFYNFLLTIPTESTQSNRRCPEVFYGE